MTDPLKKLTLYVDPSWRREEHVHTQLLFPFWGNAYLPDKNPFHHSLFSRHSFDTSLYSITDAIQEADAVLLPYGHTNMVLRLPDLLALVESCARERGLPLVVDGIGDIEKPVAYEKSIVLRYGGYRFEQEANVVRIPPYADDLLEIHRNGELVLRDKHEKPVVGFAGWSKLTPRQVLRTVLKELPDRMRALIDSRYGAKKKGVLFRMQTIPLLERSTNVTANILKRSGYSGNTATADKNPRELQKEMVDNLLASDYGLDIRGDSNASTRLFEMLSLGCIPLIVDTERYFPFDGAVDYRSFSLVVDFRDLHKLDKKVAEFHKTLTNDAFKKMQENARLAYVEHFRVDAMTRHIVEAIRVRL